MVVSPVASRRALFGRVAALALSVPFAPQRAPALESPTADVRKLAAARDSAAELLSAIPTLTDADAPIYVTQFAALKLKPAPAALAALAPRLDAAKAGSLASTLEQTVAKISAAGRDRSLPTAAAEVKRLLAALDESLALAGAVYAVPPPRTKDTDSFSTASYFGPFACEGIPGLKRKAESNECVSISDGAARGAAD
ncbi:hypothetical protein KFE25_002421 [Diacronema lutheri]|uniref:Uncharacterized protein n=2 Tax=Diacronema lutheri TaxID=2081491 RepID=A0A8J5XCR9_DIALT|nr:hypothetical protein KFE25_002421 [Diacronema lutheri]